MRHVLLVCSLLVAFVGCEPAKKPRRPKPLPPAPAFPSEKIEAKNIAEPSPEELRKGQDPRSVDRVTQYVPSAEYSPPKYGNFGYTPNPAATRQFLRTLDAPTLREANPALFDDHGPMVRESGYREDHSERGPPQSANEPTLLYRALYAVQPGWVVGKQGIGDCFTEGTMVTMADGSQKPIEQIQVGEMVLSHTDEPRCVVDTLVKQYTGDLVTIEAKGYAVPVTATADHRFVTYPGIAYGKGSGNFKPDPTPAWKAIGDCEIGERILLVRPRIEESVCELTMPVSGRAVVVDEQLGWLIGLYLAEGGLDKYPNGLANRVTLSLGRHEEDLISRAVEAFEVLGKRGRVDLLASKPSVALVRCGSVDIAQFFQALCSGNVYTKSVPTPVYAMPEAVRTAVLRGWMDGDGHAKLHQVRGGWSVQAQGVSASPKLLQDMHRLALSCGLRASLRMRNQRADRAPSGDLFLYGNSCLAVFPEMRNAAESAMQSRGLMTAFRDEVDYGIAAPIATKTTKHVENIPVYCLCVEGDHSFVANGYGVHNCVSWGWAHGCDISLAVDKLTGESGDWKPAATEALYGGGRVEGRGRPEGSGGWSDGSYGSAQASFMTKFGVVYRVNFPELGYDLTKYSASRAKQWGNWGCGGQGDHGRLDAIAKHHPVRQVALVRTFEEAAAAIDSGYPVPVCSGQGFSSRRDKDGFCAPSGHWAHCMVLIGTRYDRPGLLCLNSWGPDWVSGPKWPEDQPDGSFWIDKEIVNRMLSGNDSFAVSRIKGFPKRKLRHELGW